VRDKLLYFEQNTVSKDMFRELGDKFKEFSSIDHVEKLRTIFLPKFSQFGIHIDEFYKKMEVMEDCIK
jgi:hypothetical protein